MKPNELRIGNLVWSNYGKYDRLEDYVVLLHEDFLLTKGHGKSNIAFHFIEPIPLTEEWLLKFGFISNPYQDRYELESWYLNCDQTRGTFDVWPDNIIGKVIYLQHAHQLQNLYFALTGEELTIKEQ